MEYFDVDVRLRVRANQLPLDSESLATIIGEAVNSQSRTEFTCDAVEVEGDICWQDPSIEL